MKLSGGSRPHELPSGSSRFTLSATDLSGFAECEHKGGLELAVALKQIDRPGENEIERRMLERRGFEHEARVFEFLQRSHQDLLEIGLGPGEEARAEAARATEAAMQRGTALIVQGALISEHWFGRPDFLLKVDAPSRFGSHSYVVIDAKLAHVARARAVLQLCAYSELLGTLQGREPERFYIAPGGEKIELLAFSCADYSSYYRFAKRRFEAFVAAGSAIPTYPEPVSHCGVCRWWKRCEERRRADDHLSLVAGISARQRDRLSAAGVTRMAALAELDPSRRVVGIARDSLERVREQARIQVEGRVHGAPRYELLLDVEPGFGLEGLPEPNAGDLFLDLEGDPFVQDSGLEYLFGLVDRGGHSKTPIARYAAHWSTSRAEEKRAFEAVIDRICAARSQSPGAHVYHFGHREADALKHLSCRHNTRELEVDHLLRERALVDLHAIVKRSLRASVETYSLKQLEALYDYRRDTDLRAAARAMQLFGWLLETGEGQASSAELQHTIARYNEDDCRSTLQLRDWLEQLRAQFELQTGRTLARPEPPQPSGEPEPEPESAALAARILSRLPADPRDDDREQAAVRLTANLLDWHWRESKQTWWEFFRAKELSVDERLEDRSVLAELKYVGVVGSSKRSRICRYEFPEQEHAIKVGSNPTDPDTDKAAGEVVALGERFIELKRGPSATSEPRALIASGPLNTKAHATRLLALGRFIADHGIAGTASGHGPSFRAARELLVRNAPRCGQTPNQPLVRPGEDTVQAILRLALALDDSVLAIQGPPGSGKTFRAAEMIVALVRAGKRVGVTSNSHRVIKAVLGAVSERVKERSGEHERQIGILHIDARAEEGPTAPFEISKDHALVRQRLDAGQLDVVGGTSWAWATEHLEQSVDVLVVDEAGQMSLANVLAVSSAARNLVLFGDPAQLDQPQKGTHPPGAEASALEHLLGSALTLPPELGVFLAETRRLCPAICAFTSRVFYDGRLQSVGGLERQRLDAAAPFAGSGLRFVPVVHRGNTNQALEEVERVAEIVALLQTARYSDAKGAARALRPEDILVVAPYNAQVSALRAGLAPEVQVGTVDKFQGAEAPVVIYSLTASSADDAPRGLEFLYSLNRLNVATSRAQALVILVGSPALTRVRCETPRQMQLVNALCTYLEFASDA